MYLYYFLAGPIRHGRITDNKRKTKWIFFVDIRLSGCNGFDKIVLSFCAFGSI